MSYNYRNGYAILSYLEYPIILIQELVLILCVLYYKDLLDTNAFIGAGMYFSVAFGFLSGLVPLGILAFLVVRSKYLPVLNTTTVYFSHFVLPLELLPKLFN